MASGDLGRSIATRRPVIEDVRDALGYSLALAVSSSLVAFALGTALGLLAAFRQGGALDKASSAIAVVGVSVPHYWAGIILIIVFSVQLGWLPAMGAGTDGGAVDFLRHLTLPTVALALIPLGVITRVVRSAALDVLAQEFVVALAAKGLWRRTVFAHVVKNAAPQILTVLGLQFGFQLGGSVLVEAGVLVARHRLSPEPRHLSARHPRAPGRDPRPRHVLRAPEPRRRHRPVRRRPAHRPALRMSIVSRAVAEPRVASALRTSISSRASQTCALSPLGGGRGEGRTSWR